MKKRSVINFIVILILLIILFVSLIFVTYKINKYPKLNSFVDSVIQKIFFTEQTPSIDSFDLSALEKKELYQGNLNYSNNYSFIKLNSLPVDELVSFSSNYIMNDLEFSYSVNKKELTVKGNLLSFDITNSIDVSQSNNYTQWTYSNEYEIITSAICFQNVIVFADINNTIHIVDILTGDEVETVVSPIMLSGKVEAFKGLYIFSAINNLYYALVFEGQDTSLLDIANESQNYSSSYFELSNEAQIQMADYISNWMSLSKLDKFPELKILPIGIEPYKVNLEEPLILVYSPKEQGIYNVGLCDAYSRMIRSFTFVAVFSQTGELRMGSLDYVANNPSIALHLSENEIYYIALGKLINNTDEQDLYFLVQKEK